jgi:predicted DCC family thiol-disulfide oxidoreductase YuxK
MRTVVLFDGDCPYCLSKVRWLHSRDKKGALLFATLRSRFAGSVGAAASDETIKVVRITSSTAAEVLERSSAVLEALRRLGGVYGAIAVLAFLVPRVLRDSIYNRVATRRHSIPIKAPRAGSGWPVDLVDELTVSELAGSSAR